ncbi:D-3-phosphoglycerate dehydrogenase [Ananas comosus]|uniref:D-3-phosphoglycerate dehydrogenase n=1 Tax=Ananas comosus TaxID=4615 RepID=A0A199W3Q8_ANACO|nr:D-3-phosphoglycerate dehydrogenase [Ananas comosus]
MKMAAASLLSLALRRCSLRPRPLPHPLLLSFQSAGYSKMAEVAVENGNDSITRVLFCGYYFLLLIITRGNICRVDTVALDEVPDVIHKYQICVVKSRRLDSELIAKAAQMKLIMQFGVGLEGVDVDAATKHKIKVARIPGSATGNSTSCAEMAIYLMLGLLRKQKELEISVKQRKLGEPTGDTLLGKTVFILGFGAIGFDLAKRLRPFGVKILATKRRWSSDSLPSSDSSFPNDDIDGLIDKKGGPGNMYEFAAEADIAGIVDAKFLSSMKKGSLLVNIARGGLLDYESVLHHLESGHLGGLGIDVAWTEPFDPEDPILKLPNVLITPHVAGVTEYSYRTMAKVVGDCALQLHSGKPFTGIEIVN